MYKDAENYNVLQRRNATITKVIRATVFGMPIYATLVSRIGYFCKKSLWSDGVDFY